MATLETTRVKRRSVPLLCLLLLTGTLSNAALADERSVSYPASGVGLGFGWNSAREEKAAAMCIEFSVQEDVKPQSVQVFLEEVSDSSSMLSSLEVSAKLQLKALLGGLTMETKYANIRQINSEFSNFVVIARVVNAARYIGPVGMAQPKAIPNTALIPKENRSAIEFLQAYPPTIVALPDKRIKLSAQAHTLAKNNPEQFLRTCGDSFVSAVIEGGELLATMTFATTSVSEKRDLRAAASGGSPFSSGQGEFQQKMEEYAKSNRLQLEYAKRGGSGDPVPTSREELNRSIEGLAVSAKHAPFPLSINLMRYSDLPDWPGIALSNSGFDATELARQYWRKKSLFYQLSDILQKREEYIFGWGTSVASVNDLQDKIYEQLECTADLIKGTNWDTAAAPPDETCLKPGSDYGVRIELPIRKGSFEGYNRYQQTKERFRLAKTKRGQALEVCRSQFFNFDRCVRSLDAELNAATSALPPAREGFVNDLREQIVEQQIRQLREIRCRQDIRDASGCIANQEIDALRARIHIQIPESEIIERQ